MDTRNPSNHPKGHFYYFDGRADHTDFEDDESYHSDFLSSSSSSPPSSSSEENCGLESSPNSVGPRWCQKCTQTFETIQAYRLHLKASTKHFLCDYCNNFKDYHSMKTLRFHWKMRHSSLYCELCFANFNTAAEKRKHCVCERCMIWFKSQGRRRHHWAFSKAHKDTYCKICKVDFANPGVYNSHCVAVHRLAPRKGVETGFYAGKGKAQENKNRKEYAGTGNSTNFFEDSNFENDKKKSGSRKFREWNDAGKDKAQENSNRKDNAGTGNSNLGDDQKNSSNTKWSSEKKSAGNWRDHSVNIQEENINAPPNHYAMLGIPSNSSTEEIERASRRRRIEVHPDRLKRKKGLSLKELEAIDTKAKNVGFAAEVLGDKRLRRKYDQTYRLLYHDTL